MSFQSVLNFFLSPFGIIILIGTFSTLGRMVKSAQEQQTKKRALTEMRNAQRDSLRTGTGSSSTQPTTPLQTTTTKKATWDQKQQLRKDRIEQLRQQRVEQLKKIRQKRSGTPSTQPIPAAQPQARSPQPSQRVPAQPIHPSSKHAHQHSPSPKAYKRPVAQPYANPAPPAKPTRRRSRPKVITQQQQAAQDQARRVSRTPTTSPIALGSIQSDKANKSTSTRALFRNNLRQAIIAKEILGTPIGLRSPNASSMGTL